VVGASLLALPAWFFMPAVWTISSSQAIVNAQVIALTSPIEGVVTCPPPQIGRLVTQGSVLLEIASPLVDQKHIEELETELATLVERVAASKRHLTKTESLKSELLSSYNNYKDSMVKRVTHELEEARFDAEAADVSLRQHED
jgi:multidrug resistance efflux pump